MKTNILFFLMLAFTSQLSAQTDPPSKLPFQKGTFLTGIDLSGEYTSFNGFSLEAEAKIGYFILNGLAVGAGFGNQVTSFKQQRPGTQTKAIDNEFSAFVRYYIPKAKGFFAEVEVGQNYRINKWGEHSNSDFNDWSTTLKGALGYSILLGKNKTWSIEPKVGYNTSFSKKYRTGHEVDLSIGVRYFFGKKK